MRLEDGALDKLLSEGVVLLEGVTLDEGAALDSELVGMELELTADCDDGACDEDVTLADDWYESELASLEVSGELLLPVGLPPEELDSELEGLDDKLEESRELLDDESAEELDSGADDDSELAQPLLESDTCRILDYKTNVE